MGSNDVASDPSQADATCPSTPGASSTQAKLAGLDPLERLGLFFFALFLVGLYFILPVAWSILRGPGDKNPIFEISAQELVAAFRENAAAARKKYLGKQVIVTGKVTRFGRDPNGAPRIEMEGERGKRVRFLFRSDEPGALTGLSEGITATVRGVCTAAEPSGDVSVLATNRH